MPTGPNNLDNAPDFPKVEAAVSKLYVLGAICDAAPVMGSITAFPTFAAVVISGAVTAAALEAKIGILPIFEASAPATALPPKRVTTIVASEAAAFPRLSPAKVSIFAICVKVSAVLLDVVIKLERLSVALIKRRFASSKPLDTAGPAAVSIPYLDANKSLWVVVELVIWPVFKRLSLLKFPP